VLAGILLQVAACLISNARILSAVIRFSKYGIQFHNAGLVLRRSVNFFPASP
jgi:hypothetical protein